MVSYFSVILRISDFFHVKILFQKLLDSIKNYNLHIFQRGGNRDLKILIACFRFFYEDCNLMPGTKKLVTKYSSSAHKSSPFP